jgi:NAD(P)-dependent dehydrogenase (short-subunit alcohol dehydrogenase family)
MGRRLDRGSGHARRSAMSGAGLLAGKRAVITGGASGIGRAAVEVFTREGARVAIIDVNADATRCVAPGLDATGSEPFALVADVADETQVEAAFASAVGCLGGLDIVVGCAGIASEDDDRADRLALEVWNRILAVNLTGMFLTAKHGIRALLRSGGGSVVIVCSPTGLYGCAPGADAYSASKAGDYGLVRVMAADYAGEGIRVNGVIPGYTLTPMTTELSESQHAAELERIPAGRAGVPAEVAEVIAFLASDRTPYVTGSVWAADGGLTAI